MVNHCRKNKIIPYLVLYQAKTSRLTESTKADEETKTADEGSGIRDAGTTDDVANGCKYSKQNTLPLKLERMCEIKEESEDLEATYKMTSEDKGSVQGTSSQMRKGSDMIQTQKEKNSLKFSTNDQFTEGDLDSENF